MTAAHDAGCKRVAQRALSFTQDVFNASACTNEQGQPNARVQQRAHVLSNSAHKHTITTEPAWLLPRMARSCSCCCRMRPQPKTRAPPRRAVLLPHPCWAAAGSRLRRG